MLSVIGEAELMQTATTIVPEGIRVLEAAGARFGIDWDWTEFDWGCERYAKTGRLMPEDGLDRLADFDAIFLGAAGFPGVPDHISLWGLLIPIRRRRVAQHRSSPCGGRCRTAAPPRDGSTPRRQPPVEPPHRAPRHTSLLPPVATDKGP